MPQKSLPVVSDGHLYLFDQHVSEHPPIEVGSQPWYYWLSEEANRSFSFKHEQSTFTVRSEHKRHGWYWYMYRKTAHARLSESLAFSKGDDDWGGILVALSWLGIVSVYQGEYARARAVLEQALAMQRELGNKRGSAWPHEFSSTKRKRSSRRLAIGGEWQKVASFSGNRKPGSEMRERRRWVEVHDDILVGYPD